MTAPAAYEIRKAHSGDVQELIGVGRRTFMETYAADNDPGNIQLYMDMTYTQDRIEANLADPQATYLMLYVDQDLVGFALLKAGPAPECVSGTHPLHLRQLYVDRAHQGQGLGSALIDTCLAEGRQQGYDQLWLAVWEHNPKAQGFYHRQGFEQVGSCEFIIGKEVQQDWILCRSMA